MCVTRFGCVCSQAKRRRKTKAAKGTQDQKNEIPVEDQEMVTVGTERRIAILNVLRYCTKDSWSLMLMHSSWCQNQRQSAISDAILSWPFLWPRSKTPVGSFPTEQQELASSSATWLWTCPVINMIYMDLFSLGYSLLALSTLFVPLFLLQL